MAMGSIGGAFAAASSLLGIRAWRGDPRPPVFLEMADEDAGDVARDPLAPGEPCYEAVAAALVRAGYLDR